MTEVRTTLQDRNPRRRDPVMVLFAAALAGDLSAESELRGLALDDERASDAYLAVVGAAVAESLRLHSADPDIAACDQIMAAIRDMPRTNE